MTCASKSNGRIKVLDVGLARSEAREEAAATMAATETQARLIMGMLGYMSPEQVRALAHP